MPNDKKVYVHDEVDSPYNLVKKLIKKSKNEKCVVQSYADKVLDKYIDGEELSDSEKAELDYLMKLKPQLFSNESPFMKRREQVIKLIKGD